MTFKIKTTDSKTHKYDSIIPSVIDFTLALLDFDKIQLSNNIYKIENIGSIEEWN